MCELCSGEEIDAKYGARACIIGIPFADPTLTLFDDDHEFLIDIKYCPLCGKEIEDV